MSIPSVLSAAKRCFVSNSDEPVLSGMRTNFTFFTCESSSLHEFVVHTQEISIKRKLVGHSEKPDCPRPKDGEEYSLQIFKYAYLMGLNHGPNIQVPGTPRFPIDRSPARMQSFKLCSRASTRK
jgi:hypothetical protein